MPLKILGHLSILAVKTHQQCIQLAESSTDRSAPAVASSKLIAVKILLQDQKMDLLLGNSKLKLSSSGLAFKLQCQMSSQLQRCNLMECIVLFTSCGNNKKEMPCKHAVRSDRNQITRQELATGDS